MNLFVISCLRSGLLLRTIATFQPLYLAEVRLHNRMLPLLVAIAL